MSELKSLLLTETGIARLADGSDAVNVGPIVSALQFLTEGRGDDRGTDEHGRPLPDLLSLAFDVVQSIILGGKQAEYFRRVKQELDANAGLTGRASLSLAKQAAIIRRSTPSTALEQAAKELRTRLEQVEGLALDAENVQELQQALEGFRGFGAERWVTATSHLLLALRALDRAPQPSAKPRARRAKAKQSAPSRKATVAVTDRRKPRPQRSQAKSRSKPASTAKTTKRAKKRSKRA